jgi:hypothetical protein
VRRAGPAGGGNKVAVRHGTCGLRRGHLVQQLVLRALTCHQEVAGERLRQVEQMACSRLEGGLRGLRTRLLMLGERLDNSHVRHAFRILTPTGVTRQVVSLHAVTEHRSIRRVATGKRMLLGVDLAGALVRAYAARRSLRDIYGWRGLVEIALRDAPLRLLRGCRRLDKLLLLIGCQRSDVSEDVHGMRILFGLRLLLLGIHLQVVVVVVHHTLFVASLGRTT